MGGWDHNEWIRGLILHHEYLLALYIGYIELRHFTFLPGPKFTIFYDVYANYQMKQMVNEWQDKMEEATHIHLQETKEQIEYARIHAEYKFVKKRSIINYLTNQKLELEANFHTRTVNMLGNIVKYENDNLTNKIKEISTSALSDTLEILKNDSENVKRLAF